MMTLMYVVIWGFAAVCGLTAVYGLVWAVKTGQIGSFGEGAASIFDDEEPVGRMTDGLGQRDMETPDKGDR